MRRVCDHSIQIILTSVDSEAEAKRLARHLVEHGLAACVQISSPGQSIYRWQGRLQCEAEYYLSIKTSTAAAAQAMRWLARHHPYDVPEIIRLQGDATKAYGDWVHKQAMDAS